ncbi:MAG: Ig-like domain-containing protein, partial [Vicinamibacterales bacterium]
MTRFACALLCALLCLAAHAEAQTQALTVVNTGPQGEIASLDEASEIRIVFSEPMVTLGQIPAQVTAPYVTITPAIPGAFRWSGTTILIFTPDPKRPLPYATRYQVTIGTGATAVSGRRLARPVTFTFTTPTVKLLSTIWYRRGGTVNGPMVVLLRFNQPVRSADIAAALTASLEPHDWTPPFFTAEALERLKATNPGALEQFEAKVAAVRAVATSTAAVRLRPTTNWDTRRYRPGPNLVAFETVSPVAPESHITLRLAPTLRSPAGPATPGQRQEYTIEGERAFFINGFYCTAQCDGDARNPILMRSQVKVIDFAAAVSATNLADGKPVHRLPTASKPGENDTDYGEGLALEDAGFDPQPPNSRYAVTIAPTMRSLDGQTLGYTWLNVVDNWHARAFTSFGEGQGVWEKDGGPQLPFYARNMTDVTQWAAPIALRELMPLLSRLLQEGLKAPPGTAGAARRMTPTPDRIQSHGLDVSPALTAGGTGLVWAAVREGEPMARSRRFGSSEQSRLKSSIVQVTNLGITVKDSPQNTLIFVTRLDTGAPVGNARVSIVRTDNSTFWRGTTAADGTVIAPNTKLRDPENWWKFEFIVTAEKDGDIAYVGSDWNEGISPWEFGTGLNLNESDPLLRGSVFADRGVYKLGEEVHLKAVLRHNAPDG